MTGKEFFPNQTWAEVEKIISDDFPLNIIFNKGELVEGEIAIHSEEFDRMLKKITRSVQNRIEWESVNEVVNSQHRVEVSLTPKGMKKALVFALDMDAKEIGIEEKLIGKSTQSVPAVVSFKAKKLHMNHPLYFSSEKDFQCTVHIQKVLKPPFRVGSVVASEREEFIKKLLIAFRSLPFHLAEDFMEELASANCSTPELKEIQHRCLDYLKNYVVLPDKIKNLVLHKITEMGQHYDAELELAFYTSLYEVHNDSGHHYEPAVYFQYINGILKELIQDAIKDTIKQIEKQQKKIREDIEDFSEVEGDKHRLKTLQREMESLRTRDVSEEVMRKNKQELSKLQQKITKVHIRFETDKGMILCQEMYLSALLKNKIFKQFLPDDDLILKRLKNSIKANHISLNKEIEDLSTNLGEGGRHFLIQHAIYTEVDPDPESQVKLEDIDSYSMEDIHVVMNFVPSLKKKISSDLINSTELLKLTMETEIPEGEQLALEEYLEENSEPGNNVLQRFTQQLGQFVNLSTIGRGPEAIVETLNREFEILKAVLNFSLEQKKNTTDFKNHISYYRKLFIDPYLLVLKTMDSVSADSFNITYNRLKNSFSSQLEIKYTVAEERALLSMFKHINAQMQMDNLFTAKVFSRQIKHFMNLLTSHKKSISAELMKKILETYTVYMMGCSRMQSLSKFDSGLDSGVIKEVKGKRDHLTN